MSDKLCIYHGGCDDGFGAAYAMYKAYGYGSEELGKVEYYPGVYQSGPPDCTGKHVFLLDFSYKQDVLKKIAEKAIKITVIDHHKSAQEDLESLADLENVHLIFDMNESGAVMAWKYFHPDKSVPTLFYFIQDRDLWKGEYENTNKVIMALRSYPQEFAVWNHLIQNTVALEIEGAAIYRFYMRKVDEVLKTAHKFTIANYDIEACTAPYFFASEVANKLAERNKFGACYWVDNKGGVNFSLRSKGDFDVQEIAKLYGGGGHKNAAGFKIDSKVVVTFNIGTDNI